MVLAGPGSGKTTVITSRLQALIHESGVSPENILVITFTRAAAAEMRTRFLRAEKMNGTAVTFGTFHSVFLKILKNHFPIREDALMKESRKKRIMREVIRKQEMQDTADILLSEISYVKNSLIDPAAFCSKVPGIDFPEIFLRYENAVRCQDLMDYDDILLRTLELFRKDQAILSYYRDRFRYILIDEFQDVNPLQYAIVELLAAPLYNLFIVGDDDQAIYRFRGADPKIMLNFRKDHPGAKTVALDVNYRCAPVIVRAASRVIRHNGARYEKPLKAAPEKASKSNGAGKLEKRVFKDEKEETAQICEIIEKEAEKGRKWGDFAVLVRTAASADAILQAFVSRKIPFRFKEKIPNLFQNTVLVPVYAYLNRVLGDDSRENFLKFMNVPVRYFRREDLTQGRVSLETLQKCFAADPSRAYMAEKAAFLAYQLDFLKRMRTPYAMINYIRKAIGYDAYLTEKMGEGMYPCTETSAGNGTGLQEALAVLDKVQESALPFQTVEAWYAYIVAYTKELEKKAGEEKDDRADAVTVSTFHGAKGLEFQTVFIPDANERVTPHEKALSKEDMEEERRMFYVAMTRAIDALYLFSVRERFGKALEVSRFVKEAE